jgi:anaerobic selenocysteine-containing dehydrogenase
LIYLKTGGDLKMREKKHSVCTFCDQLCAVEAETEGDDILSLKNYPGRPPTLCQKCACWKQYVHHPGRILFPLKNMGKRGEQQWRRISWGQALDEIAEKLGKVIDRYGSEAFAVSESPLNMWVGNGAARRFMNLLGAPNWISVWNSCMGNTTMVHRLTYGYYSVSNFEKTNVIVLHGQNRSRDVWPGEFAGINAARQRGAKLIVLDPRLSPQAEEADIWLPLRYGTDAAMLLGWLNVIINENLYDRDFVSKWTVGFEQLKQRVQEYPLGRVSEITGCKPERIRDAAVLYATGGPSGIPWACTTDMQKNSTSAARCQCILRAICGYLNKSEIMQFPNPDIVSITEMEMFEALSEEKQDRQLGTEKNYILNFIGARALRGPSKRVYGLEYLDLMGNHQANPPAVFKAMRTGEPYPIKAFFSLANNALMSYSGQQSVYEGIMNQDLVVTYDHWLTPTAQLSDYILPGDIWMEREGIGLPADAFSDILATNQLLKPPGEVKDEYWVIRQLALRMGLEAYFPWETQEDVADYRVKASGETWDNYKKTLFHKPSAGFFDPFTAGRGLATPSGKVELYSSVLAALGHDPMPYFSEPQQTRSGQPELAEQYPFVMFAGLREGCNYHTNLHQIDALRKIIPNPTALISPFDGGRYGITSDDLIWIETTTGKVLMRVCLDSSMQPDTIRIPHGWWYPEIEPGLETGLSGAMLINDAMLVSAEDWNLDPEQGLANFRGGMRARIRKADR